jgi:hypothetical protein
MHLWDERVIWALEHSHPFRTPRIFSQAHRSTPFVYGTSHLHLQILNAFPLMGLFMAIVFSTNNGTRHQDEGTRKLVLATRDTSQLTNADQRSLVLLTHLPFPRLFTDALLICKPLFLRYGVDMLESACHNISNWSAFHDIPTLSLSFKIGHYRCVTQLWNWVCWAQSCTQSYLEV